MEKLSSQPLKMRLLNIFNKVFNNFKVQITVKNKLEYSTFSQKTTEYFMNFCIIFAGKNFKSVILKHGLRFFILFCRLFVSKRFQKEILKNLLP